MGLLDILNGMQNGPRGPSAPSAPSADAEKGGMSPIMMAVLALLAYKAVKHVTGGQPQTAPAGPGGAPTGGNAKLDQASLEQASEQPSLPGGGGSLGDILGSILGGGSPGNASSRSASGGAPGGSATSGAPGNLGDLLKGGLGGLLAGGAAGTIFGGGLDDLLKQLQQGGHTEAANSWVSKGPNKQIAPNDLAGALGADEIQTMMDQSGMSRQELMQALSQHLPGVIDQLTPDGRMPSADELRRLL
ncbi:YidB family protein [Bradyrhizobium sp. LHD-71]|uniref:YidB family protein n=1 Tax=Bradyrhizobium sp. LHD-71 TaxID=3072141 RepID=UPI00280DC707|nr:YidB family protein [Bradyrhizobium sp. LHD-71]MDQ8732491.1 YidB family protein [Bradyrhizobium sp. LHD-71]